VAQVQAKGLRLSILTFSVLEKVENLRDDEVLHSLALGYKERGRDIPSEGEG
jgi:hypothetical protein